MPFPSPLFLDGLDDAGDGKAGKPNSKPGSRDSSGRLEGFSFRGSRLTTPLSSASIGNFTV